MASRRKLKKEIKKIQYELSIMSLSVWANIDMKASRSDMEAIWNEISDLGDFSRRISHTEPGNAKGFYRQLRKDFAVRSSQIVDAMRKQLDA